MQELAEFTANNPWLMSGLFASALAVIFNELRLKTRGVSAVTAMMAVRVINDGGTVVDIRDTEQFGLGHIIDAHNITEKQLTENASALDRFKKSVILVCENGARSGLCATKLRNGGNEQVFSLKGGLLAWREENLPTSSKKR
jgi:rhodanese-related sulfurtransferase